LKKAVRSITRAVSGVFSAQVNAAKRYLDWNVRVAEKAKDSQAVRTVAAVAAAYYTAGAASSWFTSWASESAFATSAFASESYAYAYGAQTAISVGGGVVGGAVGGATAGGILCGSDCARAGARGGAISGGLFAGADYLSSDWNRFGQITSRATASGLSGQYQGGDFSRGFQTGFLTGSGAWAYEQIVNYGATWQSGGEAVPKYKYDYPVAGANNIGTVTRTIDSSAWFSEGGIVSRALNVVPGVNAVAGMHDVFQVQLSQWGELAGAGDLARNVFNVPGMPVAAVMTTPALFDPLLPFSYLGGLR
jgi:hypothetical protein